MRLSHVQQVTGWSKCCKCHRRVPGYKAMTSDRTFGPAEVAAAAGVPRATFHSWLARQYFPLPPSPGAGRERRFSVTDAVRVAIVAKLIRLGVSISVAANAAKRFQAPFRKEERRQALVLTESPAGAGDQALHGPAVSEVSFDTFSQIGFHIAMQVPAGSTGFYVVDVTDIAERTIRLLDGDQGVLDTPAWLTSFLSEPAAASATSAAEPAKRPAKSRKAPTL